LGGGKGKKASTPSGNPSGTASKMKWVAEKSGTTETLASISPMDEEHMWAVGSAGTILFNDGSGWKKQESGTTEDLNSVFSVDESHVWAVGQGGVILFYDGSSWKKQETYLDFKLDYLEGVFAVDATHVWAVGGIIISQDSVVLFYDGTSWKEQDAPGKPLHAIVGFEDNDVWACGGIGTIIHFDGAKWSEKNDGVKSGGKAMPYFWGIAGTDPSNIWACSQGSVYAYDGTAWKAQPAGSAKLVGIESFTEDLAWAVGGGGAIEVFDGKAWNKSSSGTTVDLKAVAATEDAVRAIGAKGTILKSVL
ncbi:MAG: WD40/YVTN/BNR-like repeat-containing protein, partial [Candidatus Geothermincolia bacterium]